MSGLLPDGFTGYEVPNTLVHGDSGEDVFDLVSKDHSAGKIEVLVSTFGAALDGPKVDYVLIAGGAWSMNSIVQNFGRIRSQCQGASAVVDILYVSDLSSNFWNNLVADAKQNCIALTNPNNGLVVRGEDYMNHCSVVGVKAFVDMKGCRLVNAYRPYGGGEESVAGATIAERIALIPQGATAGTKLSCSMKQTESRGGDYSSDLAMYASYVNHSNVKARKIAL
eukprot:CAMPEP_0197723314 /NCGR_PEP_ID=MMETSP1434-20131217/5671_1 /TAXON_ID=265543 /ORGANISM="Minutocellus polymorphus, Strain CCMP3303" /LENGTH=223 /DNA_ID=CAMNT_0043308563 /DNA_START=439 /DNA_END=1111 /DNA_ORIENTATION=+